MVSDLGEIDRVKLRSSMTLFAEVEWYNTVFGEIFNMYCNGNRDKKHYIYSKDAKINTVLQHVIL